MSDMSDNESLEKKPKRTMTDAQREALKKGRELAKLNRKARLEETDKDTKNEVVAEVKIPEPVAETKADKPKRTRKPKEVIPVRIPSPEPVVEPVKPKKTRKPKEVKVVEPVREPSPEPVIPPTPTKAKTPRQKKPKAVAESNPVPQLQVQQQWTAPRPVRPSMVFM